MKKIILSTILFVFIPAFLMADPPKKVSLSYDKESGILKVLAIHEVKDVEEHFIDLILVTVDGKEVKKISYKKQQNTKLQEAEIKLPGLKKGNEISVKVRCNEFGSKKESLEL